MPKFFKYKISLKKQPKLVKIETLMMTKIGKQKLEEKLEELQGD